MKKMLGALAALVMSNPALAEEPARKSVAPDVMKKWAPALASDTDNVLFGDVWLRSDLSPRDRSLVTVTALIAMGKTEQLTGHLGRALDNGVTPAEISGVVSHLAFYSGWPSAVSALAVIDRVFAARGVTTLADRTGADEGAALTVTPPGQQPQSGPADNFTGKVSVSSRFSGSRGSAIGGATVTFSPGARTNWHSHPGGQLLVVTQGEGRVQDDGGRVRIIRAGDTVWTAPGVRHWHGAAPGAAMTHVAVAETVAGKVVEWMEPVTDAVYRSPAVEGSRP